MTDWSEWSSGATNTIPVQIIDQGKIPARNKTNIHEQDLWEMAACWLLQLAEALNTTPYR